MPTLVAIAGLTQQTHAGIGTGGTQTKYFDTINGTPGTQLSVVQDSDFASGWCLEITGNAATAFAGFFNASNNGVLGSSGTLVGSFRFKFPTMPSNDFDILRIIGTGGGNDAFLKYLTSTTGLQGILGASTQLGPMISGGAIKRADFKAVLNSGSQTLDWQIDGAAQTQVTLSATTQNLFKAGFGNDAGTQNGTIRVGDIVLSLTAADYPLGAHKVVLLKVDPSGTITFGGSASSTDWRTFAGATPTLTAWNATTARAAIDEVPPNLGSSQDGLCLVTDVPTNTWYVEIPMTTYTIGSGETVSGARSVVCGWQATTSGANCGLRSWNGTTERTLVNTSTSFTTLGNNSTTAVGWLCKMLTVADIDTQTELDALALRWGFSTDANPDIGVQAAYVELAIKESSGVTGTVTVTQADQTSTVSGILGYTGTAAPAQAANTSSASGSVAGPVTGTAAVTQAAQSSTATGTLGYTGTASPSQAAQTAAANGTLGYTGTAAISQAPQTASATGVLGYTGTSTAAQAANTASASGLVTAGGAIVGSAAPTQANQLSTAAGVLGYSGTATISQSNQTSTASGKLGYTGSSAATQAANTSAASGAVTGPVSGTAALTQANQTAAASGVLRYVATAAASQAPQVATVTGVFFVPVTGIAAATQAPQVAAASGSALGHTIIRPDTGTTPRAASGITPRPFTGVTPRP